MPQHNLTAVSPRLIMIQDVARGLWDLVALTEPINIKKTVCTLTGGVVVSVPFDLQSFGVYIRANQELGGPQTHHFTRMKYTRGQWKFDGLSIKFVRLEIYMVIPNGFKLPANFIDFTLNLNY